MVIKTLEDEQYVVIKAYKFTVFEIWRDFNVLSYIACPRYPYIRVYRLYDTKKSQNLINGKLISLYNNAPFIFKCYNDQQYSQRREKTSRKYQTRNTQNGPNVFLSSFFLLSSDGLAQYCVNLSHWFTHETAAFCTEQCTTPSFFQVLRGTRNHSLKNYSF